MARTTRGTEYKPRINWSPDIPGGPWYVFRPDGGHAIVRSAIAWGEDAVPTGAELGRYGTYAEAIQAHPTAYATMQARAALEAGNK